MQIVNLAKNLKAAPLIHLLLSEQMIHWLFCASKVCLRCLKPCVAIEWQVTTCACQTLVCITNTHNLQRGLPLQS